jgi:hypothetical protein
MKQKRKTSERIAMFAWAFLKKGTWLALLGIGLSVYLGLLLAFIIIGTLMILRSNLLLGAIVWALGVNMAFLPIEIPALVEFSRRKWRETEFKKEEK